MQQYDLVVIGSGPGGQRAAFQAPKAGKLPRENPSVHETSASLSRTICLAVVGSTG